MLEKKYRLSKEKDINTVLRKGKSFFSEYFTLRLLKQDTSAKRFGFIFSKKIHNKPTQRNLPKKRMRHTIAGLLDSILFKGDFLFIGKKKILELNNEQLADEMLRVLKKANVFK